MHMSTSAASAGMRPGGVAPSVSTSACSAASAVACRLSWSAGDGVRTAAGLSRPGAVDVVGAQPGAGAASCPGLRGISFLTLTYLAISGFGLCSASGFRSSSSELASSVKS